MAGKIADIPYCSSSFLMHRTVIDQTKVFDVRLPIRYYSRGECDQIHDSFELEASLKRQVEEACKGGCAALALSGGIDSAILAKFMPKGSKAYTFKCVVPGIQVTDESPQAARYAQECGLIHEVVEIYWEDVEAFAPKLMLHKGAPIHSIEVQIYKAACKAKADGCDILIFGESADCNYGGLSNVMSREWTFGEYVDRYSYVLPYKALKEWSLELTPFVRHCRPDGFVDVHEHFRNEYFPESMGSYANAMECAGVGLVAPYANTWMACDMDYERVRAGENKYLIREVFNRLYPGWTVPKKTPMPRPTEQWLEGYAPTRSEFWPNCTTNMTGDQKWLVWALEAFLNQLDTLPE